MKDIQLKIGKIYMFDYGGTQVIGKFLKENCTQYDLFDCLHYWSGFENFRKNTYCVKHGIENIREASDSEKMNLIRFEIEHNCI